MGNLIFTDEIMQRTNMDRRLAESPIDIVIITRFNMYLKQYTDDWSDQKRLSWSTSRLQIFEDICMPSVANQTTRDFTWLILCDKEQSQITEKLLAMTAKHKNFNVLALDRETAPVKQISNAYSNYVASSLFSNKRHFVASARLDCDDALNREFISNLHLYSRHYFAVEDRPFPVCFTYVYGAQALIRSSPKNERDIFALAYPYNPNLSLIERKADNLRSIYSRNHGHVYMDYKTCIIGTTQPMWIQCIHGENQANGIRPGTLRLDIGEDDLKTIYGGNLELSGKSLNH